MRYGLPGGPVPRISTPLPYLDAINSACSDAFYRDEMLMGFSPFIAYASAINETIQGELNGEWNAATVMSQNGDGGHGLFQLTSSFPQNWEDPYTNARWACEHFFMPAEFYWRTKYGFYGDDLVRAILASFNAGIGRAEDGHLRFNDVDHYDTDRYAERGLDHYHKLLAGENPFDA